MIIESGIVYTSPNKDVNLYHGSKAGIVGRIVPNYKLARKKCDFGRGFYLGNNELQVKSLICQGSNPTFYEVTLRLKGLSCVKLSGMAWVLYIAYNRERFFREDNPKLYDMISKIDQNCDVIMGKIADDRIAPMLDLYFGNIITDEALIGAMQGMNLGEQYNLKTQRACNNVVINNGSGRGTILNRREIVELILKAERTRKDGARTAEEARRKFRGIGKYFEQITEEEKYG